MTFSTDDSCVIENKYSEDDISAMIVQSKEARKYLRKLGRVMKTVATNRLKELKHPQAVEKLATWRRTYGFDRLADDDDWVYGPRLQTPEHITASLWSDLNALKDAILISGEDGFSQRAKSFLKEIGQGTVSFTDAEFAILKRFVERRGRDAAHVADALVDTALYCSTRSRSPEISSDVHVCMEKNEEGRLDPESDQFESPSTGTGFETPGQQCHPN